MPGKRNWLKKITRWIFDAPNERTSKKERSIKSEAKQQEERNQDKNVNDDRKIKYFLLWMLSILLFRTPELIHTCEGIGMFFFKLFPVL